MDEALNLLEGARHIHVFSGAGMSADSGIATYRDVETGVWENVDPTAMASIDAWAESAFAARALLGEPRPDLSDLRSIGIPTWFYGHEPPNVFGDAIAKFFSNALREDDLLTGARDGIIVLEGAAGTVQEIFQSVTPLYYAADDVPLPHLVLVGRSQWTDVVPVWPVLTALAAGRRFADHLHLVETPAEAFAVLADA